MKAATFDGYTVYRALVRLGAKTVTYQVRTAGTLEDAYMLARRRGLAEAPGARVSVLAVTPVTPEAGSDWASRIRALRYRLGESRATFGARLRASWRTVEHWEQGMQEPRPETQTRITLLEARLQAQEAS